MDAEDHNASTEIFSEKTLSNSALEILYEKMCTFTANQIMVDSNIKDSKENLGVIKVQDKSLSALSVAEKIQTFSKLYHDIPTGRRPLKPMIEPRENKHNRKVLVPTRRRSSSVNRVI